MTQTHLPDGRIEMIGESPALRDNGLPPERVTLMQVRQHPHTMAYINGANQQLMLLGYTEHGPRHAGVVSRVAADMLAQLGYPQRESELAAIAGLLHDIGNVINREMHGQSGALLAREILHALQMPIEEIVVVMGAIGNHEEERGTAISAVAAAVILADKADVHFSRVQNPDPDTYDIHDRVNMATTYSRLRVSKDRQTITLELTIDTHIAPVMDYFEIFLSRMAMCRRAAQFLQCRFGLEINGNMLL